MAAGEPDVVSDEAWHGRRSGRPRRWPFVVVLLLLVAALGARWADGRLQQHEFDHLLAAVVDVSSTADHADGVVYSTRTYTMPQLVSSSSAAVRAGLAQLIDDSAGKEATQLRQDRSKITGVALLPWHGGLRGAREQAVAYIDARIAALDDVAGGADPAELAHTAAGPAFAAARLALENAAPTAAERQRVVKALAQPGT